MMFLDDVAELKPQSHKKVRVSCDIQMSPNCRKEWITEYRDAFRNLNKNGGKIVCKYCRVNGRSNPNCRHPELNDNFFEEINNEEKAYFLGLIASEGSINKNNAVIVTIHKRDKYILEKFRDLLCKSLEVIPQTKESSVVTLRICSKKIVNDIRQWLKVSEDRVLSYNVRLPDLPTEELKWAFLRGFFDGDGCIRAPSIRKKSPECKITTYSEGMRKDIINFSPIKPRERGCDLEWYGVNALDFMFKLYDNATIYLERKYNLYRQWCTWIPILRGHGNSGKESCFWWAKTHPDAVPPTKRRASDVGYDLTLIEKHSVNGNIEIYRTGIKVTPDYGWYFMLAPRSSIIKTGYMLANSVGIIDRGYTGEILVPLIKCDTNAPELKLPSRVVQLIPVPIIHCKFVEVDDFETTERNEGGFGSTGR